jgi:hypothetical protein
LFSIKCDQDPTMALTQSESCIQLLSIPIEVDKF